MTDDLEAARQRREWRKNPGRAGAFGGLSGAKRVTATRVLVKVEAAQVAAENRNPAAYFKGKAPTPERISMALNLGDFYGPEVDRMLGGEEPMVDEWEAGVRVPTVEEVRTLAELTGFPVRFFYLPPPLDLHVILCGPDGCSVIGEEGSQA